MKDEPTSEDDGEHAPEHSPHAAQRENSPGTPSQHDIAEAHNEQVERNLKKIWQTIVATIDWVDNHNRIILAIATIAIAALTWSLASDSSRQAGILEQQLSTTAAQQVVMQGQLDEMRSEQRPWIKVDNALIKGIEMSKYGLHMSISINVTNIGKSPATHVFVIPKLVTEAFIVGIKSRDELRKQYKDSWSRLVIEDKGFSGKFIFPGTPQEEIEPLFVSNEEINLFFKNVIKMNNSERNVPLTPDEIKTLTSWFVPAVVGCVSYAGSPPDEIRQTGFIYRLYKTGEAGIPATVYVGRLGQYSITDVFLRPEAFGTFAH